MYYFEKGKEDLDKETGDTEQDTPTVAAVDKTPEQVFESIVRVHREAERIALEISDTLAFEPEELNAGDIKELLEKMSKLKMHLEIMEAGYNEYTALSE